MFILAIDTGQKTHAVRRFHDFQQAATGFALAISAFALVLEEYSNKTMNYRDRYCTTYKELAKQVFIITNGILERRAFDLHIEKECVEHSPYIFISLR